MTILLLEGFEYWGTEATLERFYDAAGDIVSLNTSTVRTGTYSAELYYSGDYVEVGLGESTDTLCTGVAFYAPSLDTSVEGFLTISGPNGSNFVQALLSNGELGVYVKGNSTYYYSGYTVTTNVWNYVEFKAVYHNTAGSVELRLNGSTVLSESGIDTAYLSADVNWGTVQLLGDIFSPNTGYFDDWYVTDGEFLGPIKIYSFVPTSNGTHTDFTPSAGSNYQNVDEASPDDGTTYNEGSDLGDKDTYIITPTGVSGQIIKGVGVRQFLGKEGSLGLKTKMITRINSTDYQGSNEMSPGEGGYGIYHDYWQVNPDDSSPWEYSDLTSAEFGLEITGISTTT